MNISDPRIELLECSDILVSAAEFEHELQEHAARVAAFYNHYGPEWLRGEGAHEERLGEDEEYAAQFDVLLAQSPRPAFTPEELETALWQLPELAVGLLMVFTETVDELNDKQERAAVTEIVRPKLYVPGT